MLNRIEALQDLRDIIDEYENLWKELSYMSNAWTGDDPYEAACSDPGLQYEKSEEIDSKYSEIINICKKLIGDFNA